MPRFNKWLSNIKPDDSVLQVGRGALRIRLAAVTHFLKEAGSAPGRQESIHQLRIWTRRSAAALRLFEPLVPRNEAKKLKKRLRKIRAAAGQERDCDILLERLRAGDADSPRKIFQAVKKQRRQARRNFTAHRKRKLRRDTLQKQFDQFLGTLQWPKRHSSRESPPFAPWCRAQLVPLAEHFFSLAGGALRQDAKLHELRIAGKRLRYALELAPSALPPRIHQRLYDGLSDLQERLGIVCDHLAAVAQLEEWLEDTKPKERPALQSLIRSEKQQLATSRKQFQRWWTVARRRRLRASWDAVLR